MKEIMEKGNELYVIVNKNDGNYIGVDKTSGGYPFHTTLHPKLWSSKQDAKKYADLFRDMAKDWELHKFVTSTEPCSWI
jgi:hypothetical protein